MKAPSKAGYFNQATSSRAANSSASFSTWKWLGALLFAFLRLSATGGDFTLNFEDGIGGNPVGNTYTPQGVTFGGGYFAAVGIDLNQGDYPPKSGLNVIWPGDSGVITATFDPPVPGVTGYYTYTLPPGQNLVIKAYAAPDLTGNPLYTVQSSSSQNTVGSGASPNELLGIGGTVPLIRSLSIQGAPNAGSFTLDDFSVTSIFPAPPIAGTPTGQSPIAVGQTEVVTANATGTAPLRFQWYMGLSGDIRQPLPITGASFTTPPLSNNVAYWFRVSDSFGQSSDSPTLAITVTPIGLGLGTITACAGEDVSIPFTVSGFAGVGSIQTSITWDPSVVTYTGFGTAALPGLGQENLFGDPTNGLVSLAWEDATLAGATLPDGSTLFTLNFHLSGTPGSQTPVLLTNSPTPLEITDADGNVLAAAINPGVIQINGKVNLTGRIAYYQSDAPVSQVVLQTTGKITDSSLSGIDGLYHFLVPSCLGFDLVPQLTADPDASRGISMTDVSLARGFIQGKTNLTSPFALLAADVNGSRTVTAADLRQIRLFIFGSRTNFSAAGGSLWRFIPADYVFPDPTTPWMAPGYISYSGLNAETSNQNFKAVKLGDVDGSWSPAPAGLVRRVTLQGTAPPSIHLKAAQHLVNSGDLIQVEVKISQVDRLTTAQFSLKWDPTVLQYVGTDGFGLPGLGGENLGEASVESGHLAIGWDDPNWDGISVAEDQTVVIVHFKAIGHSGSSSRVEIARVPTAIELSVNHRVVGTGITPGLVALRSSSPGNLGLVAHAGSQLDLWYEAPPDTSWSLQASLDLIHWNPLGPPVPGPSDSLSTVSLPVSADNRRYYRVIRVQ